MKKIFFLLLITVQLFGYMSCKKDDATEHLTRTRTRTNQIPDTVNSAPKVSAGNDIFLLFPSNETDLTGSYSDVENNIREFKWTKISGPSSYRLANENSLSTRLDKLEKGTYQFKLRITDSLGLSDSATMNVHVNELSASPSELILTDRTWIFPWSGAIEIKNFLALLPPNAGFLVYIRRENSPDWKPVSFIAPDSSSTYEYFIESRPGGAGMYTYGSLYITYYGNDASDEPDVKIVY